MDFNRNQLMNSSSSSSNRPTMQMLTLINNPKQNFLKQLRQTIQGFWNDQLTKIYEAEDVQGPHMIPLARVKKIMKYDEQVKIVSADTTVVFAKACELFIMELTLRAWMHTRDSSRRTLQRNDLANAILDEDLIAFLREIVPLPSNDEGLAYAQPSNNSGVPVPIPIPYANFEVYPDYPMKIQATNQVVAAFYARNEAMQHSQGHTFCPPQPQQQPQPPPSSSSSQPNPYLGL